MMKKETKNDLIILGIILLVVVGLVGIFYVSVIDRRDWDFIQSVGGLDVRIEEEGKLKVICDVSGLSQVTRKPERMNSGLVIKKVGKRVEGNEIGIYIVTTVPMGKLSPKDGSVSIVDLSPGSYRVVYLNPDGSKVLIKAIEL